MRNPPDPESNSGIAAVVPARGSGTTWQPQFVALAGRRRLLSSHMTDRRITLVIAHRVESFLDCGRRGEQDDSMVSG